MQAGRIRMPLERFRPSGLAWIADDWIVFSHGPADRGDPEAPQGSDIWRVRPDGRRPERLVTGTREACRFIDYRHPSPAGPSGFAFAAQCDGVDNYITEDLMLYDGATGEVSTITPLITDTLASVAHISWRPEEGSGLVAESSQICAGIALVTEEGAQELPVYVGEGEQRFRLDDNIRHDVSLTNPCVDWGRAAWPAWSPDGETIAFFASPQSAGLSGFARLDAPWNLYAMDAEEMKPRVLVPNVVKPRDPRWSPDSGSLVFSGNVEGEGLGTWLLRMETGTLHRLDEQVSLWHAWSPDGDRIVTAVSRPSEEAGLSPDDFFIYELTPPRSGD